QKHGISKEELDDELLRVTTFPCSKRQYTLLAQIAISVAGGSRHWKSDKGKRTMVIGEVTKLEEAEIRAKFNFYWKEWEKKQGVFLEAFIQKNSLYPKDTKEVDVKSLDE